MHLDNHYDPSEITWYIREELGINGLAPLRVAKLVSLNYGLDERLAEVLVAEVRDNMEANRSIDRRRAIVNVGGGISLALFTIVAAFLRHQDGSDGQHMLLIGPFAVGMVLMVAGIVRLTE